MKLMCKISGFLWEIISAKYMYLGQNYCKMFRAVYSILLSCSYTDWAQNRTWCFIHVLSLSPVFGLKFKVLLSYCVLVTEKKVWRFIWNYFLFTTWMINKLDHLEISIVKSKQNFGWSKRGFLPQIFVSWWKLKWQITLCSNKILLKT